MRGGEQVSTHVLKRLNDDASSRGSCGAVAGGTLDKLGQPLAELVVLRAKAAKVSENDGGMLEVEHLAQ